MYEHTIHRRFGSLFLIFCSCVAHHFSATTATKYKKCRSYGYSDSYCKGATNDKEDDKEDDKDDYDRVRRLQRVDARQLVATNDECADAAYDMHLVVKGAHFAGLATPIDNTECPSLLFHADSSADGEVMEKIALRASAEHVATVGEDSKLHLGVSPLNNIVEAFEGADVGRDGIMYDAISNNCVAMLRNMADPLNIPVDDRMVGFVSKKLLDGSAEHMFEMMKKSPMFTEMFNGGRRLMANISKEDMLSKIIKLYV